MFCTHAQKSDSTCSQAVHIYLDIALHAQSSEGGIGRQAEGRTDRQADSYMDSLNPSTGRYYPSKYLAWYLFTEFLINYFFMPVCSQKMGEFFKNVLGDVALTVI